MGRNGHGPILLWAEMTRNRPGYPKHRHFLFGLNNNAKKNNARITLLKREGTCDAGHQNLRCSLSKNLGMNSSACTVIAWHMLYKCTDIQCSLCAHVQS